MGFHEDAIGHRKIGNEYIEISKDINMLLAFLKDKAISFEEFQEQARDINKRIKNINRDAEKYTTNKKDFEIAKEGINYGEENYTDKELDLL